MQVNQLMNTNVISVSPEDTATTAARLLNRHNIGALPVCAEGGKLKGIVTDRDIVLRCVAAENDPSQVSVREIMSRNITSVSPDADVREATRLMASEQVRRLPVTDGGRVIGMLSLGDMARTHSFDMEASKALSDISSNVKKK